MNAIFEDARLGDALKEYVAGSRWFRAKTKQITGIEIEDALRLPETDYYFLVLGIRYSEGEGDRYVLPIALAQADSGEAIARAGDHALTNALNEKRFRDELLNAVFRAGGAH